MDPKKVEGILNWPEPKTVHDVQAFLGFVNLYRCFIKNFAKIASPLHALTKKDQTWKWMNSHCEAFNNLKSLFTSKPILHHIRQSIIFANSGEPRLTKSC